jgi:hypothetical protein
LPRGCNATSNLSGGNTATEQYCKLKKFAPDRKSSAYDFVELKSTLEESEKVIEISPKYTGA